MQKEILLHICCAPCAGSVVEKLLAENWKVVLYWYNPNIFPQSEHDKRLEEVKTWAEKNNFELVVEEDNYENWKDKIADLSQEREGGARCQMCYEIRLDRTAKEAQKRQIPHFASTLTNSRHKRAEIINPIGIKIGNQYGVEFLERDWKKGGGELRSVEISRENNFYRQEYCGCEFSVRKK